MTTEAEDINLLTVIIDTNPRAWALAARDPQRPAVFLQIIQQILVFINAHLSLKFDNELAIIASHTDRSRFLYPLPPGPAPTTAAAAVGQDDGQKETEGPWKPANVYKQFFDVDQGVVGTLKALIADYDPEKDDAALRDNSMIAGSLSLAQSYINRVKRANETANVQSRIFLISISPDRPSQYIATMNSIFAAQKIKTRIDVCRFRGSTYGGDSVFLPQAAHITGGIFLEIPEPKNALQYLLVRHSTCRTERPSYPLTKLIVYFMLHGSIPSCRNPICGEFCVCLTKIR
ncbi:RNA polymerase II transcription factor B subunit 4 [Thoreauomyces humboldtii]|nr:RNA polymerase II transcription factor B subunit 4 [Thoreauomyces humboldtii]